MGGSTLSVTALFTDYQPQPSTDSSDLHNWAWWWEHTRWRIPQSLIDSLRIFPCRIGNKPAFLCDFDVSDREQIYWIRKELARYIPEHASDIVFYQSSRPWAGRAIQRGLSFLYMVEPTLEVEVEPPPAIHCSACGSTEGDLVAIGEDRVCLSCLESLAEPPATECSHGDTCQACGAAADRSVGGVSVCGDCVDRLTGVVAAA